MSCCGRFSNQHSANNNAYSAPLISYEKTINEINCVKTILNKKESVDRKSERKREALLFSRILCSIMLNDRITRFGSVVEVQKLRLLPNDFENAVRKDSCAIH